MPQYRGVSLDDTPYETDSDSSLSFAGGGSLSVSLYTTYDTDSDSDSDPLELISYPSLVDGSSDHFDAWLKEIEMAAGQTDVDLSTGTPVAKTSTHAHPACVTVTSVPTRDPFCSTQG